MNNINTKRYSTQLQDSFQQDNLNVLKIEKLFQLPPLIIEDSK